MKFHAKHILAFFTASILVTVDASAGSSIGVKFAADISELFPDETCGVVPQNNWNNARNAQGTAEELVDAAGNKTKVKATWGAGTTWGKGKAGDAPDYKLLQGKLEGGSGGKPAMVGIEGIPFKSYTLYIYFSTGEKFSSTSTYKVNETEYTVSAAPFNGEYKVAEEVERWHPEPEKRGNYLTIPNMSGDITIETSSKGWQNDASGDFRAPICAVQIVETGN